MRNPTVRAYARWMIRADMPDVLQIERASFDHPWSEDEFYTCLRRRECIGAVLESDDRVVAYLVYELTRTRLRVLNFAVDPDRRRSGLGGFLVRKLIDKMNGHRRARIDLTVREGNLPAQLFFRRLGFTCLKVLPGYYAETTGEDGYVFRYSLPEAAQCRRTST